MSDGRDWRTRMRDGRTFEAAVVASWRDTVDPTKVETQMCIDVRVSRLPKDWLPDADQVPTDGGTAIPSPPNIGPTGKKGFIDLHVAYDEGADVFSVICEVKDCDWDSVKATNVRGYTRRYVNQIWRYISAFQANGKVIVPAVIFSRRPKDVARVREIEKLFDDNMVAVVWQDEGLEARRARSSDQMGGPYYDKIR